MKIKIILKEIKADQALITHAREGDQDAKEKLKKDALRYSSTNLVSIRPLLGELDNFNYRAINSLKQVLHKVLVYFTSSENEMSFDRIMSLIPYLAKYIEKRSEEDSGYITKEHVIFSILSHYSSKYPEEDLTKNKHFASLRKSILHRESALRIYCYIDNSNYSPETFELLYSNVTEGVKSDYSYDISPKNALVTYIKSNKQGRIKIPADKLKKAYILINDATTEEEGQAYDLLSSEEREEYY